MFFYAGLDEGATGELVPESDSANPRKLIGIRGRTEALEKFRIKFVDSNAREHFSAAIVR